MRVVEEMIVYALKEIGFDDKIIQTPFPIYSYKQALEDFGADKFDLRTKEQKKNNMLAFAWVIDFPFFEKTDNGDWTFTHNPFSRPLNDEHENWLLEKKNISKILTSQYDLVLNNLEIAGGSIRAHNPKVLQSVFEIMGYKEEEIKEQFGHMLEAFELGTPPHGGCAHGFERLLMAIYQEDFIREVQAFPQTGKGTTSIMQAPSPLDANQLDELGLSVVHKQFNSVFESLIDLLNTRKIKHHLYEHEPVFTSEEAANIRGDVSLSQGAKAMVLKIKKESALFILPADLKIDLKKLRQMLGTSQVKLASLDSIEELTGVKAGAVPPFGSLMGLNTLVDSKLSINDEIVFNAGRNDRSIRMKYQDFIKLENPQVLQLE